MPPGWVGYGISLKREFEARAAPCDSKRSIMIMVRRFVIALIASASIIASVNAGVLDIDSDDLEHGDKKDAVAGWTFAEGLSYDGMIAQADREAPPKEKTVPKENAATEKAVTEAVDGIPVVWIESTLDGTKQPSLFWHPEAAAAGGDGTLVPLLVALHSWGGTYKQTKAETIRECRERGWAFLQPNFRGPNTRPEACASDLAVQDVLDAVDYARGKALIDPKRIYVIGASGGGHMALVMAGRAPKLWAGVSAWVPITDLAEWHRQCAESKWRYDKMLDKVCGGPPGDPATDEEYRKRSPIFHLEMAAGLPIEINAGILDGHEGSVPIDHTLKAFNILADANGHPDRKIPAEDIEYMVERAGIPPHLAGEREKEPGLKTLFRRTAGPVRVTIFQGGHTIRSAVGIRWLAQQRNP